MSSVYWAQAGPRTFFNIPGLEDPAPVGGCWVLDIITTSGSSQIWFSTAYPNPGVEWEADPPQFSYDALTLTDSDDTAAALKLAVDGLEQVTSSTLTAFEVSGTGGASVIFPQDEWQNYTFAITIPAQDGQTYDSALLTTRSPADGMLSQGDIDTVTAALQTFISGLSTVVSVAIVQQTATPATA